MVDSIKLLFVGTLLASISLLTSCTQIKSGPALGSTKTLLDIEWNSIRWTDDCPAQERSTTCKSTPIHLLPGHYEFNVEFASLNKDSSNQITLQPFIVSSKLDGSLLEIPLQTQHPKGSSVNSIFTYLTFYKDQNGNGMLFPPEYPNDGGWFPENPSGFIFVLNKPAGIKITKLKYRASKWNLPLSQRISTKECRTLHSAAGLNKIAVNLQGSALDQLNELKEARANWNPQGPVLIISQISPEDVTENGVSVSAQAVLKELQSWSQESDKIRFGVSVNPYLNDSHRKRETTFYNDAAFLQVRSILLPYLAAKADLILLRTDDFTPSVGPTVFDYGLSSKEDLLKYRSLAHAHLDLINKTQSLITQLSPDSSLAFVPPWYATAFIVSAKKRGMEYLDRLTKELSKSIPLVWTGPVVRSLWIDTTSVKKFQMMSNHHPVILWDNTPYARAHKDFWLNNPERATSCSLFEPYDIKISEEFLSQLPIGNKTPLILVNTGVNPVSRIQLETTQRYISLPKNYAPEETLWQLLCNKYGAQAAATILQFDQSFWQAYQALKNDNYPLLSELTQSLNDNIAWLGKNSPPAESLSHKLQQIVETGLKKE